MNKNTIDDLFNNLKNDFDTQSPNLGHQNRFLEKLNSQNSTNTTKYKKWVKPLIGIAASIVLFICISIFQFKTENTVSLASISPKMAETETIFLASLNKELESLNSEDMPEHQEIIVDALFQLQLLQEDFNQLIFGLKEQPDNKLILEAMILNFQSRINVLQNTKDKIQEINNNQILINQI